MLLKSRSSKRSLLPKCLELETGNKSLSRNTILRLRHLWVRVAIAIHSCKFVSNSKKFSWRWDFKRCQQIGTLRVHSGTLILFSNLRVTQLETCMTPFSSRTQRTVKACLRNIWKQLRKFTRSVASVPKAINMSGKRKKPRKIF